MAITWAVIAHRTGARIYENHGPGKGLTRIRELTNEVARKQDHEQDADKPGRTFDRHGSGRHAKSREETPHERAASNFARQLAESLTEGRHEGRFDRLVLAAEPKFLGMLRESLDEPTARHVTATLAKDLGEVDERKLADHLGEVMPV
jgi:protein required for attachment to host cells